jgi:hypothetical protein
MDRADLERSIVEWLRTEEGFRPRARTGAGYRWERDDGMAARFRTSISSSRGSLRSVRNLTHRQTDLGHGRHLVEIDTDSKIVSTASVGVAAGSVMLSLIGGVISAFGFPGGNDVLQFTAVAAPVAAMGIGAGVITAKAWAAQIRNGVERALDGISAPELRQPRRRRKQRKSGVARVLDNIGDAIEDAFD